jgi:capsule polysaccharide modification protein KpsS
MLAEYRGKRVLLLQGPMGPFFARIGARLGRIAASVTKVNFNGGDSLFFHGEGVVCYRGRLEEWPGFLERLLVERRIDAILLFGDCRPIHRAAIEVARRRGVEVGVFEEGYLRPNHVTFERGGVNGNSPIPRDPEFYRGLEPHPLPRVVGVGDVFARSALIATVYSLACFLTRHRYPHYTHHRDIHPIHQAYFWVRGAIRKLAHARRDRSIAQRIVDNQLAPHFLVALQVHLDSQISHSRYATIEEFITEVVDSFAHHAPEEAHLLVKHHPFDRPYRDYTSHVDSLRERYGLGGRLIYVDLINLPQALRHARGVVVINSTVGLSAVQYGTPTKCMGTAVYDIPGLTHQASLDSFWTNPEPVDEELSRNYRFWLRVTSQLNGSVWTDVHTDID